MESNLQILQQKFEMTDEQVAELEKILGVTRRWIILGDDN